MVRKIESKNSDSLQLVLFDQTCVELKLDTNAIAVTGRVKMSALFRVMKNRKMTVAKLNSDPFGCTAGILATNNARTTVSNIFMLVRFVVVKL